VMSLALQPRYQISERDIPQCLAVYHKTRGDGILARWRNSTRRLATSGFLGRDIRNYAIR